MTDQTIAPAAEAEANQPTRVSAEEYLEKYAHDFYEWHDGELIKLSPVTDTHDDLDSYFGSLFKAYFALKPIGIARHAPFLMRVDSIGLRREPDVQIILNENPGQLTRTGMLGPADICIEIVSPESVERDFVQKLQLYEQAGVKEYWLVDYLRHGAHFYRLNDEGIYILQMLTSDTYETPLLPSFRLHIPTLWSDPLPDYFAIGDAVRAMVSGA
jgi:Uma2 family endonuclease